MIPKINTNMKHITWHINMFYNHSFNLCRMFDWLAYNVCIRIVKDWQHLLLVMLPKKASCDCFTRPN